MKRSDQFLLEGGSANEYQQLIKIVLIIDTAECGRGRQQNSGGEGGGRNNLTAKDSEKGMMAMYPRIFLVTRTGRSHSCPGTEFGRNWTLLQPSHFTPICL